MFSDSFLYESLMATSATIGYLVDNCCPFRSKQLLMHRLLYPWLTDHRNTPVKFEQFSIPRVTDKIIPKCILTNFVEDLKHEIEGSEKKYSTQKLGTHKLRNISGSTRTRKSNIINLTNIDYTPIPPKAVSNSFGNNFASAACETD